jgi:hypothetical protein
MGVCKKTLFSLKHVIILFDKLHQLFAVLFDGCLFKKFKPRVLCFFLAGGTSFGLGQKLHARQRADNLHNVLYRTNHSIMRKFAAFIIIKRNHER